MRVTLYSFTKKHNSTAQLPSGSSPLATYENVYLKQSTDIDKPTLLLEIVNLTANYLYIEDIGRYYFISKIRLGNNNIYEVECELDALATFKTEILAHTLYVVYSTSNFNRWIRDDRVPIYIKNSDYVETSDNFIVGSETNLFQANTNETVLITAVSKEQGIVTWISTEAGIKDIVANLFEATDSIFESLAHQFGDAMGSIVQVMRIPIPVDALPSDGQFYDVYLGTYPVTVNGEPIKMMQLSNSHISAHASISIPLTYTDFRFTEPYCQAKLTLPFVGCVDFSLAELAPEGGLEVRADIELMTGSIMYTIHNGGTVANAAEIVATYSGQIGCLIPIASAQIANASNIVGGVLGSVGTAALGTALGNPAMATGGYISTIMNLANAFYSANQKSTSVVGSYSGGRGEFADRAVRLCVQKFLTACEPSDLAPIEGRPLCAPALLSTLTGYCRCAAARVALSANAAVVASVEELLNSGIYIE